MILRSFFRSSQRGKFNMFIETGISDSNSGILSHRIDTGNRSTGSIDDILNKLSITNMTSKTFVFVNSKINLKKKWNVKFIKSGILS